VTEARDVDQRVARLLVEALKTNRSPNQIRSLATRYVIDEDFVIEVAHAVADGRAHVDGELVFFESAPSGPPKGSADMNIDIGAVSKIFAAHGTSPSVRAKIVQRMHLDEALVDQAAYVWESAKKQATAALTESGDASGIGGEGTVARDDGRQQRLAADLAAQVNAAESKGLERASTRELEAVAAARFGV